MELVRRREDVNCPPTLDEFGDEHIRFIIPLWADHIEPGIVDFSTDQNAGIILIPERHEYNRAEEKWLLALLQAERYFHELVADGLLRQEAMCILPPSAVGF